MHGNMTRTFGFLALTAFLLAGCGAKGKQWSYNNKVEGTAKIDGVPLAGVVVAFSPDDPQYQGPLSHGYTDENGHFELKADNRKAGAVIATHFVTVLLGTLFSGGCTPAGPIFRTTAGHVALSGPINAGSYCVAVSDVVDRFFTVTETITLQVSHP